MSSEPATLWDRPGSHPVEAGLGLLGFPRWRLQTPLATPLGQKFMNGVTHFFALLANRGEREGWAEGGTKGNSGNNR
jgi:hypothetical protein